MKPTNSEVFAFISAQFRPSEVSTGDYYYAWLCYGYNNVSKTVISIYKTGLETPPEKSYWARL